MSKIALSGNASGTGTFTFAAPGTNTDRTLTLPDASGTVATTADIPSVNPFTLGTAVASTSGTAIDFTGIPSWAKRVTVMLSNVSTNGSSPPQIQIGDSGGIETSGYLGANSLIASAAYSSASFTTGFGLGVSTSYWSSSSVFHGAITLSKMSGNLWSCSGALARSDSGSNYVTAGTKTLSDTLDRVRITTANGTDTFDAGTINVSWEG